MVQHDADLTLVGVRILKLARGVKSMKNLRDWQHRLDHYQECMDVDREPLIDVDEV